MAIESLELYEPLSGFYIHVSARTETYHGPCQFITEKVKLYLTYQVSAWVRIGTGATTPQKVNVKLQVDEDRWVNAAEVEINDNEWHELGGSFRIEQPVERRVMVYVEGPSPGIDLMVGGLQIFPVHRHMRIPHLRKQTDEVRKRDVILKFSGFSSAENENDIYVKIKQTENSFPIGSCLNRNDIDNEDLVDFFLKHFNWAVFENELKWNWIQETKKKLNYREADELLGFCTKNNIPVRGHCLFWEVEKEIQNWVRKLPSNELERAVQDRLKGLLKRYEGRFKHYDVNNEMMHGSFYQEKLGEDFRATMFKNAQTLDKNAVLFVNDYHIEDGYDGTSSPQKYVDHVRDLQKQGAPVGCVGIQGHAESPVGPIICSALNKLKILKLPIWFTEIDVSSDNEFVRADDLEVMLREAFAHPSVEGIMLWGFWELSMFRKNSHLVDAEGDINEAGKRFLTLKKEWLSEAHGYVDNHGHFDFRGFLGSYQVEVQTQTRKVTKTFVVGKDQGPQIISLALQ